MDFPKPDLKKITELTLQYIEDMEEQYVTITGLELDRSSTRRMRYLAYQRENQVQYIDVSSGKFVGLNILREPDA